MKYIVIQRYFDIPGPKQFEIHTFDAKNQEEAWEYIEESISHNMSQEWLMTESDYDSLKEVLK